jgi:acyl-CoA-binding protein
MTKRLIGVLVLCGAVMSLPNICSAQSIDELFTVSAMEAKELPFSPDNQTKLLMYALFQQGRFGNNTTPMPAQTQFTARAQWNAWYQLRGMSQVEAKKRYIKLVRDLVDS